jgi:hypothetical protein
MNHPVRNSLSTEYVAVVLPAERTEVPEGENKYNNQIITIKRPEEPSFPEI